MSDYPLIDRLSDELGYPVLTTDNREALTASGTVCLFFSEDPKRYPEALDVAVVLPELVTAFAGDFTPVVVSREIDRELQREYGFRQWPALVFLRDGQYLGAMEKIRDWAEYKDEIPAILAGSGKRAPGIGIPVTSEPA